jgi:hypothetical protein
MEKEKMIYDADQGNLDMDEACSGGHSCPEFVLDEGTETVTFIDKQHRRVPMSIPSFNSFVAGVNGGQITPLDPVGNMDTPQMRTEGFRFAVDMGTKRVAVLGEKGERADMSVKHFNRFVGAIRSGEISTLKSLSRK